MTLGSRSRWSWRPNAAGDLSIVCGLEPLGLGVATSLLRLGERVTVVARDPDPVLATRRGGRRPDRRGHQP